MQHQILLALISSFATSLFASTDITHIETQQPLVCLSFDDGPSEGTEELLDLFKRENVKATFFVMGKYVAKKPELCQRMVAEGHEIGNHSYTHPHLDKLGSIDAIRQEIESTQAIIESSAGVTPLLFRAPYLDTNADVYTVLNEHNLVSVHASRYTSDWKSNITADEVFKAATESAKAGDIILMHGWSPATREAMPRIIENLRGKGLRFVTVSEMRTLASAIKK